MSKLSIITIKLNNKEGLQKTMASVFSRTFSNDEYVIIDGGSTDGSVDLIESQDAKITYWVSKTSKGIYNVMNRELKNQAEYNLLSKLGRSILYSITCTSSD